MKLGTDLKELHKNETIKDESNYLRGTLAEELADTSTGAVSADNTQLTKFHGIYMQDDRDIRAERRKKKLEPAYSFMARIRIPGGLCTSDQWLKLDELADKYANGTIRITTRQAVQYHGIIKNNLKTTIAKINEAAMDTIAACGDVNRNVMCNVTPELSHHFASAQKLAQDISDHLTPQTGAYSEIWLDGEKVNEDGKKDEEPIYGKHYLPRKFKTVVAVPPSNDVDIFAHCLGFIAIIENDKIIGWNVTVGGGMGNTHGREDTFPRTADVMAFCKPEQAVEVAEAVAKAQRDNGNRQERAHARLKYTVERMGVAGFREAVETHLGYKLEEPKPFEFTSRGDQYGWHQAPDGTWILTLFIANGRVKDTDEYKLKEGLREIAKIHKGDFRLTSNQHLALGNISDVAKPEIEALLDKYKISEYALNNSGMRKNSMACVALPTCALALAESERYLPDFITRMEDVLEEAGLRDDDIVIRMTGCPNGCARPFLAEIGFVGTGPGKYNLLLGASFTGDRLNKLYKKSVTGDEAFDILKPMIHDYAKNRNEGEHFGDFVIRAGYIKPTTAGNTFHKDTGPAK